MSVGRTFGSHPTLISFILDIETLLNIVTVHLVQKKKWTAK